jgi:hypothetical protein
MHIENVRAVVNELSWLLLANLAFSWILGKMKMRTAHITSHISALALTGAILVVVEFWMVPLMGRHFPPLLFVHYIFLFGAVLFGVAAVKRKGGESPYHGWLGRYCLFFWGAAIIIGLILAN